MSETAKEWEVIYSGSSFREKNRYPSEEVVSFVMRRFGATADRSKINVLDMGCGWGNNLQFLKENGFSYTGIDFSQTAVDHCLKSHSHVICANLTQIPLPDQTFDLVIDRMAVQHNSKDEVKKIFEEVRRLLKPGGVFFSVFAEVDNYTVGTTYLKEADLRKLTENFSSVTIDYTIQTEKNQSFTSKRNLMVAVK